MEKLSIKELQENFYTYLDRVEAGESFLIKSGHVNVALIPYRKYEEIDEIIRIHTDHEEGC